MFSHPGARTRQKERRDFTLDRSPRKDRESDRWKDKHVDSFPSTGAFSGCQLQQEGWTLRLAGRIQVGE